MAGVRGRGRVTVGIAFIATTLAANVATADPLDAIAAGALARCEAISADRGTTAMIFNPRDRQVAWERSECLQALAVQSRDERLCGRVVERRSWVFDGSGVSPEACRRALEARRELDREEAARIRDLHRPVDVAIERNGNGRDFDLRVSTRGSYAHRYRLEVFLIGASGSVTLMSIDQPLGSGAAQLVHLVGRERLDAAVAALAPDRPLRMRAALSLAATSLDERAIHAHLPASDHNSVVESPYVRVDRTH